ncbi:MAG: type IV pilus twitching motility protein PilT [Clostridia bacterium]|nr:type IV pilus twitching motility protein PilT [Clostridia bacterium]
MYIELNELLKAAIEKKASDIHITVGRAPVLRINGDLKPLNEERLTGDETLQYARACLEDDQFDTFKKLGEVDCSISVPSIGRFRVNVYRQRGSAAVALRVLASNIPSMDDLSLPASVRNLCTLREGLILVTGPTGSGKSTTIASMINEINNTREAHILTLEDPIEYLHRHNKCTVNQREIGHDSMSYQSALRAALREDPDIIFIGEMRDLETISIAITAAETGHLVLSTLHTLGAAKTVDRLIDVFPPHQQQQVRVQVSMALKAVLSQRLIPEINGNGRVAAYEFMSVTPAVANLIREGKTASINMTIQTGGALGMQLLDKSIADLYRQQKISKQDALNYCVDRDNLQRFTGML